MSERPRRHDKLAEARTAERPLTDRDGIEQRDDQQVPGEVETERRPYVAPELTMYGTVAKLTQGVGGSGTDFSMRMMACL